MIMEIKLNHICAVLVENNKHNLKFKHDGRWRCGEEILKICLMKII